MYTNGFNRSCDMLRKDIEFFYKLIAENKHDHQSQKVKERSKSIHNTDIFPGKACCSKPSIFYFIFNQGIMKQLQSTLLTSS